MGLRSRAARSIWARLNRRSSRPAVPSVDERVQPMLDRAEHIVETARQAAATPAPDTNRARPGWAAGTVVDLAVAGTPLAEPGYLELAHKPDDDQPPAPQLPGHGEVEPERLSVHTEERQPYPMRESGSMLGIPVYPPKGETL